MSQNKQLERTAAVWKQFVGSGHLEQEGVSKAVLASWKICRETGMDPWETRKIQSTFVPGQEIEALRMTKGRYRPAETLEAIGQFGDENRVVLSIYDNQGCFVEALNHEYPVSMARELGVESLFLGTLTEHISGTNAVTLAMRESTTVRLAGHDHYHSWFHAFSCSATPLRDGRGNIIGAVGASSLDLHQPATVLSFLRCLADIYQHWRWLEYERNRTRYWQGSKLMVTSPALSLKPNPLLRLVGDSTAMKQVREMVAKIAPGELPVLLVGESGVGKDVAAKIIHDLSERREGPLIAVNCGSISETVAESTLFGYEGGSFTGARSGGKAGLIEAAHGGTLFLDELENLSPVIQAMLLRCLEEKTIIRMGGTKERALNFRLITATKVPHEKAVGEKGLREDFYYRIAGYVIPIPPLRKHRKDIPLLMKTLLQDLADKMGMAIPVLSNEAVACCCHYPWPGNVRQLKNLLEQLLITCRTDEIKYSDLPEAIRYHPSWLNRSPNNIDPEAVSTNHMGTIEKSEATGINLLGQIEKKIVKQILDETNGNISESARRMGISRPTLYRILNDIRRESHNL